LVSGQQKIRPVKLYRLKKKLQAKFRPKLAQNFAAAGENHPPRPEGNQTYWMARKFGEYGMSKSKKSKKNDKRN
jgi:hypothetical protein